MEGHARVLEGERVYLRGVREADVNENYHRWMNTPAVTRYMESRFRPYSVEALRRYVSAMSADPDHLFLAILLKEDDRHVGNIKVGPVNWIHRHAEVGIMIGEEDCWGRGYATEAIRLASAHAFRTLNLRRLTAGCYEDNRGSLKAFERAGFSVEGVRPRHFFCDGGYTGHVLMGLSNPAGGDGHE